MASSRHTPSGSRSSSASSSSQNLNTIDSSAPLILVHESESSSNAPFDFSSDTEDDEFHDARLDSLRRSSVPPLSPATVFLYLTSPCLKLGVMLLPNIDVPLKVSVPALVLFAALSAFSRQVWYMLAKYMRKTETEEIILDAFARGKGSEYIRSVTRIAIRFTTGTFRALLATVYLQESVEVLLPFLPNQLLLPSRVTMSMLLILVTLPLSLAPSLASARVKYATWLSSLTYIFWLGFVSYAHARGTLALSPGWLRMSPLWTSITAIGFAFASSSTLPLYTSLKGSMQPQPVSTKTPKSHSFRILSVMSVAVAALLVLPLGFFSSQNTPDEAMAGPQRLIAFTYALTLLLSIPAILVTTPALPVPFHSRIRTPLTRCTISVIVFGLSLVPSYITVLSDVVLVLALGGTYFFPALIHITTHHFKRPLSIVVNSQPTIRSNISAQDDLLQRKERALQRRQLRRRIGWDVGVWAVFIAGLVWIVWALGRAMAGW